MPYFPQQLFPTPSLQGLAQPFQRRPQGMTAEMEDQVNLPDPAAVVEAAGAPDPDSLPFDTMGEYDQWSRQGNLSDLQRELSPEEAMMMAVWQNQLDSPESAQHVTDYTNNFLGPESVQGQEQILNTEHGLGLAENEAATDEALRLLGGTNELERQHFEQMTPLGAERQGSMNEVGLENLVNTMDAEVNNPTVAQGLENRASRGAYPAEAGAEGQIGAAKEYALGNIGAAEARGDQALTEAASGIAMAQSAGSQEAENARLNRLVQMFLGVLPTAYEAGAVDADFMQQFIKELSGGLPVR